MFTLKPAIPIVTTAALSSLMLSACYPGTSDILLYEGTFDADHVNSPFLVSGNRVRLRVYPESGAVVGEGTLVVTKTPAYEGDTEQIETYVLDFEGTHDVDSDSFRGQVNITGGQKCSASCEGVDDSDWDYYADWTGQLARYDTMILGDVDGDGFDFTAAKVVVKLPQLSDLLR